MRRLAALVVDDSPTIRHQIVRALSTIAELEIVDVGDGIDALRLLATRGFDIILTDIHMPILDGLKLTQCVRRDARHAGVPIIVITTARAAGDRERAMALGATAYLNKPIADEAVAATARGLLKLG